MKEIPTRSGAHLSGAAHGQTTEAVPRPESDSAKGRDKLEDTLGEALTRMLARAGLSVRVVPSAQEPGAAEAKAGLSPAAAQLAAPAPTAAPAPAPAPAPAAVPSASTAVSGAAPAEVRSAALPARDELIILLTMVVAGKVLGELPAGAHMEERAASGPAASGEAEAPSTPGSQPVSQAPPPEAIPWQALASPPVSGPAPPAPAPVRRPPISTAQAPAAASSKPAAAPSPFKGRGFTIRY